MQENRNLGTIFTPEWLVEFMVSLSQIPKMIRMKGSHTKLRVLEPGCAHAPFLQKIQDFYANNSSLFDLIGVEIDEEKVKMFKSELSLSKLNATIVEEDFLLWEPPHKFDLIIGNPPYGIIGDASRYPIHVLKDKKSIYKKKFQTWYGKYNIYGAFIEHSVNLLDVNGKLVFVCPASWLILDDFKKLRLFLSQTGDLIVYSMGKVFQKRNVSCVILVLQKTMNEKNSLTLYDKDKFYLHKEHYRGEMIRFETKDIIEFERSNPSVSDFFEIKFAARSTEFKKYDFVSSEPSPGYVPVLTGRNLKPGWIDYETCYSSLWADREQIHLIRDFYAYPHIVVAHTKGIRAVAALDKKGAPWREELHLIHRNNNIDLEIIVDYLNSTRIQFYLQTLYRDIVPHLTTPMLKRLPVVW